MAMIGLWDRTKPTKEESNRQSTDAGAGTLPPSKPTASSSGDGTYDSGMANSSADNPPTYDSVIAGSSDAVEVTQDRRPASHRQPPTAKYAKDLLEMRKTLRKRTKQDNNACRQLRAARNVDDAHEIIASSLLETFRVLPESRPVDHESAAEILTNYNMDSISSFQISRWARRSFGLEITMQDLVAEEVQTLGDVALLIASRYMVPPIASASIKPVIKSCGHAIEPSPVPVSHSPTLPSATDDMKILCLHGVGGSAKMFEAQTNQITKSDRLAGCNWEYVDGIMQCNSPDDRIMNIYPPPYLAYYKSPIPEDVEDAIEYIEGIIEDEGPFDGILGFSQGCCVAAALMFERQKRNKDNNVPFRFGVFMGASLPFNADDRTGKEAWQAASKPGGTDSKNEFRGELEMKGNPGMISFPDNVTDQPVWLGRYHSQKTPDAKLRIPILHVIGRKDPYALQAKELASRMHENSFDSTILEHDGGHEVPRESAVNEKIARQISSMIATLTIPAF